MRAFAVLMMIQGHAIHAVLDGSYQTSNLFLYDTWQFLRAFTAPFFIFVSGTIFTFLLFQNEFTIRENPRIIKGVGRGVSLILIGYLLRYPTIKLFNLSAVSHSQWLTFFTVDALHLIGTGMLSILLVSFIAIKVRVNILLAFAILVILLFYYSPIVSSIAWGNSVNIFITSYITFQFGSQFPLFPYLIFMFLGAILGILLSQKWDLLDNLKKIFDISFIGIIAIFVSYFVNTNYSNILLRIGVVVFMLSIFGFASRYMKSPLKVIESLARNSLWLYIIHLIIIYGSPVSIGLFQIVGKTLSAEISILIAVIMLILMTIISLGIDKLRVTKYNIFRKV